MTINNENEVKDTSTISQKGEEAGNPNKDKSKDANPFRAAAQRRKKPAGGNTQNTTEDSAPIPETPVIETPKEEPPKIEEPLNFVQESPMPDSGNDPIPDPIPEVKANSEPESSKTSLPVQEEKKEDVANNSVASVLKRIGRKRRAEKKSYSIYVSVENWEELERRAEEANMASSYYLDELLTQLFSD